MAIQVYGIDGNEGLVVVGHAPLATSDQPIGGVVAGGTGKYAGMGGIALAKPLKLEPPVLLLAVTFVLTATTSSSDLKKAQGQMEALTKQLGDVNARIASLQNTMKAAEERIRSTTSQLAITIGPTIFG